jgi:transposase InsO family protein
VTIFRGTGCEGSTFLEKRLAARSFSATRKLRTEPVATSSAPTHSSPSRRAQAVIPDVAQTQIKAVVPAYRAADDRGRETEAIVRGFALRHPAILPGAAFNLTKPTDVIEWATRRVLAHRVAVTMDAEHAVAALEEVFAKYGVPEIVNTDQGSQFTRSVFTDAVLSRGIALSMDGKGSWRDNVFIERLWRGVKYEEIYLKAYESVGQARKLIANYLTWYNQQSPHSSLSDKTRDDAYFAMLPAIRTAA